MAYFNPAPSDNIWGVTPDEEANLSPLYDLLARPDRVEEMDEDKENFSLRLPGISMLPSFQDPSAGLFQTLPVVSPPGYQQFDDQENKSPERTGKFCPFCKRNGEGADVYTSHRLRDSENNVICPILFHYTCPVCGATGPRAHTKQYCPMFKNESNVKTSKKNSLGRFIHHYR